MPRTPAPLLALALAAGPLLAAPATRSARREAVARTLAPVAVRVEVREQPDLKAARVTVRLDREVPALVFDRDLADTRPRTWVLAGDSLTALRWARRGERDALVPREAGQGLRVASFLVPARAPAAGDAFMPTYEALGRTRLLDVENLRAAPELAASAPGAADPPPPRFDFVLAAAGSRTLTVSGLSARGTLAVPPAEAHLLEETLVHLADGEPADYGDLDLATTEDLPPWLAEASHAHLPRAMGLFEELTGGPLDRKILVLVAPGSRADAELRDAVERGTGSLVELVAEGGGWGLDPEGDVIDWVWLAAHQLFHVFNQRAFDVRFPAQEGWLTEGTAEFASLLVLEEQALLTPDEWRHTMMDRVNTCLAEAADLALVEAPEAADADCGATVLFLADLALRRVSAGAVTARDLLPRLFDRAAARGDYRYSRFDLLEVLQDLSGDTDAVTRLAAFLHVGLGEGPAALMEDWLRAEGLAVERAPMAEVLEGTDPGAGEGLRLLD